jgi:hypothetical protein
MTKPRGKKTGKKKNKKRIRDGRKNKEGIKTREHEGSTVPRKVKTTRVKGLLG